MLKILSRISGSNRTEIKDARLIYEKVMVQSRSHRFFGENLCKDTTDGRMEVLCLHLSVILFILRTHGKTGKKLSQAIYDVMIDDFDVALREEGLSDTGVARRIKPLAKMFFTRAKQYADAFEAINMNKTALANQINNFVCRTDDNVDSFVDYTVTFLTILTENSLGQIAQAKIDFPKFH